MSLNPHVYSDVIVASIRSHFEGSTSKYVTYPKFVFLCGKGYEAGKYDVSNRGVTGRFLKKLLPDTHIVLSEKLWEERFDGDIDLLIFEEFLAEISDAIILFVESPGSFCELGTFAYADDLFGDKLIIVLDEKYRNSKSFISTGPVLKAKKDNSQVLYAPIDNGAILSSRELRTSLENLVKNMQSKRGSCNFRKINTSRDCVYINSFIIEILELLRLAQPIDSNQLLTLYKKVKNFDAFTFVKRDGSRFKREIQFSYILKLLETAGIISHRPDGNLLFPDYKKAPNFMLDCRGKALERERNRILCKKYQYGDPV